MSCPDCRPTERIEIPSLGKANIDSLVSPQTIVGEQRITLTIGTELAREFVPARPVSFELAGPRSKIYFDPSKTKCAIVTCGGLCPGINDVIRAIVRTAYLVYGVPSILGITYGLSGFLPSYGFEVKELTLESVEHIHEFGGTMLGTSRGKQPPEEIVNALERLNVSVLFIIGGDGTMHAAHAIQQEVARRGDRIAVVGVPKTIDNDINFIPQSFGFETAVEKAADAIRCVRVEAESVYNGIGLVKLMGRESGFIAAAAALSMREVDFVLIPEAPFVLEGEHGLCAALERCLAKRHHAVIVLAEGAGRDLLEARDPVHDPDEIGALLLKRIAAHCRSRNIPYYLKFIDPSYLIRSVPANANDRLYCGVLGQHAVHAAMSGKTGVVVGRIMNKYVHLPLELVSRERRTMDVSSDLWRSVLETTGQEDMSGMPAVAVGH